MNGHIKSKKGLKELLRRYQEAGIDGYWITVIKGCIEEGLAMDEWDYMNSPRDLQKLWKGLK